MILVLRKLSMNKLSSPVRGGYDVNGMPPASSSVTSDLNL